MQYCYYVVCCNPNPNQLPCRLALTVNVWDVKMCVYDSKNAIYSWKESTTRLNNHYSYIYSIHYAPCQQSVMDGVCRHVCHITTYCIIENEQ